jgi:hypothetical protein
MIFAFGLWNKLRPSRATSGEWRISDGKFSERFVVMFGALKVVGSAVSIKDHVD